MSASQHFPGFAAPARLVRSIRTPIKLIIDGPPASGKGTMSKLISEATSCVHISTGDILRDEMAIGSPLGEKIRRTMERGELVADEDVLEIVKQRLVQPDCTENGWLFDGFPRTKVQAEFMHQSHLMPDAFIVLDVTDEECVARISGRRVDPVTKAVYHVTNNPAPPEVAARLIQREDDTPEVIADRLRVYHANAHEIHSVFRPVLAHVSCGGTVQQNMDAILEYLSRLG